MRAATDREGDELDRLRERGALRGVLAQQAPRGARDVVEPAPLARDAVVATAAAELRLPRRDGDHHRVRRPRAQRVDERGVVVAVEARRHHEEVRRAELGERAVEGGAVRAAALREVGEGERERGADGVEVLRRGEREQAVEHWTERG